MSGVTEECGCNPNGGWCHNSACVCNKLWQGNTCYDDTLLQHPVNYVYHVVWGIFWLFFITFVLRLLLRQVSHRPKSAMTGLLTATLVAAVARCLIWAVGSQLIISRLFVVPQYASLTVAAICMYYTVRHIDRPAPQSPSPVWPTAVAGFTIMGLVFPILSVVGRLLIFYSISIAVTSLAWTTISIMTAVKIWRVRRAMRSRDGMAAGSALLDDNMNRRMRLYLKWMGIGLWATISGASIPFLIDSNRTFAGLAKLLLLSLYNIVPVAFLWAQLSFWSKVPVVELARLHVASGFGLVDIYHGTDSLGLRLRASSDSAATKSVATHKASITSESDDASDRGGDAHV